MQLFLKGITLYWEHSSDLATRWKGGGWGRERRRLGAGKGSIRVEELKASWSNNAFCKVFTHYEKKQYIDNWMLPLSSHASNRLMRWSQWVALAHPHRNPQRRLVYIYLCIYIRCSCVYILYIVRLDVFASCGMCVVRGKIVHVVRLICASTLKMVCHCFEPCLTWVAYECNSSLPPTGKTLENVTPKRYKHRAH